MKTINNISISADDLDFIIDLMDNGDFNSKQHQQILRNLISQRAKLSKKPNKANSKRLLAWIQNNG